MGEKPGRFLLPAMVIVLIWGVCVGLRLAAPSDLADNDQPRPLAYASDMIVHGAWVLQRDVEGKVTTKPPLHAWLIGALSLPTGEVTRVAASIPSALAMLGTALGAGWIVMKTGRRDLALVAGMAVLLSPMGVKMTALVRTDSLLTAMVFAAFAIGVAGGLNTRADERARWRIAYWFFVALGVMTKGPVALLFSVPALLVRAPLEDDAPARRRILRTHALAALMVPGFIGAWFVAATIVGGREVFDVMVGYEIYAQTVYSNADPERDFLESLGVRFEPLAYVITWFVPWSVLATIRWISMLRGKANEPRLAGYEWAFVLQLFIMLPIFIIASHKRSDHLAPLIPGIAILGTLALGRVLDVIGPLWRSVSITVAAAAALAWVGVEHFGRADDAPVRLTRALGEAGRAMESRGIEGQQVLFVRTGILPQMPIRAKEPEFGVDQIGEALAGRQYVLTHDLDATLAAMQDAGVEATVIESFGAEDVRVHLIETAIE